MTKNAAERIHDVARIKIAGCDFMQHRRKQNKKDRELEFEFDHLLLTLGSETNFFDMERRPRLVGNHEKLE